VRFLILCIATLLASDPSSGEFCSPSAAHIPLPSSFKRCYRRLPFPGWLRQKRHFLRPQPRFQFGDNGRCVSCAPPVAPTRKSHRPAEWEDESPYPEVRAAVSNTDDMEMPADTFRAWMIGLFWAIFIPGLNQFFHFRYPSITIGSVRCHFPHMWTRKRLSDMTLAQLVAQLLSFPLGCAWARTVPGVRIFGVSLNPGPFSLKEHVVITVMATVGSSSAYAVRLPSAEIIGAV
jgi:hypothetical protein